MKSILCTSTLLLLSSSVHGFAPPKQHTVVKSSSLKLISPDSFSLLLSDATDILIDAATDASNTAATAVTASEPSASFAPTYSKASYYTTLALYAASFPGLWSQIKRSTKAKVKRKTYVSAGEAAEGGKELRQQAGEIMAYMKANNYEVAEAGETITFRGLVARSTSQAFFLTFCTALGMASLALVLQIQFQDVDFNWFYLTLLSPYAGIYYWRSGDRVDDMKVKLAANDDDTLNEITIEGNDEEIERMWRTLDLQEKGMVKVEGILSG
mmetsp:Transcript_82/g.194  ORF Transcript_82/g.194 Transcript_82/m.194 type:complete len:269 (+) Transcript_82:84-890(+)